MTETPFPALLTCGFSPIVFSGQSGGVEGVEGHAGWQQRAREFKGGHLSLIVTCQG